MNPFTTDDTTPTNLGPCPFQPGDRIRSIHRHAETATVVEITAAGFRYRLDHPSGVPRLGVRWEEGECFPAGFDTWEALPAAEDVPRAPLSWTTAAQSVFVR